MRPKYATDLAIAELAARQAGVVLRAQLVALGLSDGAIKRRLGAGRLLRLYRGVYAVGHAELTVEGRRFAAVSACGSDAVLSHRSAAAVWGLRAVGPRFEITVPLAAGRITDDRLCVRRTGRPLETARVGILPVTTPARTALDLAAVLPAAQVEAALEQSDRLELFDLRALRAVAAAHPRHPGAKPLTLLLDAAERQGLTVTFSDLEILMRSLCGAHGLPQPDVNAVLLGHRRDFHWPGTDLVVETDGWAWHRTRAAFEQDRARDQELVLAGYRVVRFTHRQIVDDPAQVAATLRGLLAR